MVTIPYSDDYRGMWDDFVEKSCKGSFLFNRAYMEYHKERFEDCSLLLIHHNKLKGLLPATKDNEIVKSHGGLTYGGLIHTKEATYQEVSDMLDAAIEYYRETLHANQLLYKPIPQIYCTYPSEQDIFYMLKHNAKIQNTKLASIVQLADKVSFSTLRRRHLRKDGENWHMSVSNNWKEYWEILSEVLKNRHDAVPVHTLEEILMLKERFPQNIQLVTAEQENRIVAGAVLFISGQVVKTQYIASSDQGCASGALEKLFDFILNSDFCKRYKYLDFGTSMKDGKDELSTGLNFQKEGMGGRGICYHEFMLNLK